MTIFGYRMAHQGKELSKNASSLLQTAWANLHQAYRMPEEKAVYDLVSQNPISLDLGQSIQEFAGLLVDYARHQKLKVLSIENFFQTHQLNSQEGLAMMCLAEALLRIPDSATKSQLIRDKVGSGDWHTDGDTPFMTKLANIGLLTTGKVMNMGLHSHGFFSTISSLVRRFGDPLIRQMMAQTVKIMGQQFVMGETIHKAIERAQEEEHKGYRHSYDMLGEAAYTQKDAETYFENYSAAIVAIGQSIKNHNEDIFNKPGISVKLSALHPRFEVAQKDRLMDELFPKLLALAKKAKEYRIGLTIDAEESERLCLSLELAEKLYHHPELDVWDGLGIVAQAYQKRATYVIDWAIALTKEFKKRMGVRLVKGAYWDSEIKRGQELGLADYAVFTQKCHTDVSYLVCAEKMLDNADLIYPQFATHNAYTVSAIYHMAQEKNVKNYEFQRLHGMGETVYQKITENSEIAVPCRIYAPVGEYDTLLAYLVRRLLENGANSSFVNQIHDTKRSIASMVVNPFDETKRGGGKPHPKIPLPKNIYLPTRMNSEGVDLSDENVLKDLTEKMALLPGLAEFEPTENHIVSQAMHLAHQTYDKWSRVPVSERAACLDRLAQLLQNNMIPLIHLLVNEAGKTIPDAVVEVREAIDFCYYYAQQARLYQTHAVVLPGPTGEINQLSYHSRGVFVCISPFNFPLAIFLGQITAALVCGNTVIAKPASQCSRVAKMAVNLAYQAGIPRDALRLMVMPGSRFSEAFLEDERLAGVAFTGSVDAAHEINQTLAKKPGPIVPLIAETGGINAMIVDSSALPEQVVRDVLTSAFQSAGQRCSALRLLVVQNDVADVITEMLVGAMAQLRFGHSQNISTDVSCVIDENAKKNLQAYTGLLSERTDIARLIYECPVPEELSHSNFVPPQLWQLASVRDLTSETFGPILHMVRFRGDYLDQVMDDINSLGYGLTLGVHSRLESTIQHVFSKARVGNVYINRSIIGAVVGVQPFGGEGLSGTGFKAGGPNYLLRFMVERTFTQDTTAAGGNASLLASL
jgi:RHH-type proline utilization regulon transcriptional repressor/proline dehydrogenase/delta 1-pyrroline-5-carboxylate dehydrogenase